MIKGNREDMKGLRGASVCNRIPENDTSPSKKINKSFCPNSRNFRIFYVNGKRELRVQMELKLLIGWPWDEIVIIIVDYPGGADVTL